MSAALERGRSAMMLVPEIALTPVFSRRLRSHFGDQVAIFHSSLQKGERFDEWTRVKNGEARVVIGTRSAVFAPVQNLGLIVVDEEHESTYRQQESPYYNARDVAIVRAQKESATVVLGSATPSLESFHNARDGKYQLPDAARTHRGATDGHGDDRRHAQRVCASRQAARVFRRTARSDSGNLRTRRTIDHPAESPRLFEFYSLPLVRRNDSMSRTATLR